MLRHGCEICSRLLIARLKWPRIRRARRRTKVGEHPANHSAHQSYAGHLADSSVEMRIYHNERWRKLRSSTQELLLVRPGDHLGAASCAQLLIHVGHVPFDRAHADEQLGSDLAVATSVREQIENLALARS
jgi:hypothetical protein